jgi:hypothetical protein
MRKRARLSNDVPGEVADILYDAKRAAEGLTRDIIDQRTVREMSDVQNYLNEAADWGLYDDDLEPITDAQVRAILAMSEKVEEAFAHIREAEIVFDEIAKGI